MHFFHVSSFLDRWPDGKCLIFREAAIASQTSVGMKRDWTSPKGVHQLDSVCWSEPFKVLVVPLLNDRTPPHGPEEAVPVPRRP